MVHHVFAKCGKVIQKLRLRMMEIDDRIQEFSLLLLSSTKYLYSESFEFNNGKHISNHMQGKCIHIDGE